MNDQSTRDEVFDYLDGLRESGHPDTLFSYLYPFGSPKS
jgi:hypothetical protein